MMVLALSIQSAGRAACEPAEVWGAAPSTRSGKVVVTAMFTWSRKALVWLLTFSIKGGRTTCR